MRFRLASVCLVAVTCTLGASSAIAAPAKQHQQHAPKAHDPANKVKVIHPDYDKIGLSRLRRQQRETRDTKRKLAQLREQRQQAREQLDVLSSRARTAKLLARQTEDAFADATEKADQLKDKLNKVTLRYIDTVGATAFSEASQAGGPVAELAQLAAESADTQDAVLVYTQGELLVDHVGAQMSDIRSLASDADHERDQAFEAQQAADNARLAADAALRDQAQLEAALTKTEKKTSANLADSQAKLNKLVQQLVSTEPDIPMLDETVASLPAARRIVALAQHELALGVREVPDGSNESPDIARYRTATVGASGGQPWCAYFASYIAARAGVPIGDQGQGMGYVPDIIAWAQRTGRYLSGTTIAPAPGDLIMWPGHIGIVIANNGDGTVTTVEGNSSNRVASNVRDIAGTAGFARLVGKVPTQGGGASAAKTEAQTPDDTL